MKCIWVLLTGYIGCYITAIQLCVCVCVSGHLYWRDNSSLFWMSHQNDWKLKFRPSRSKTICGWWHFLILITALEIHREKGFHSKAVHQKPAGGQTATAARANSKIQDSKPPLSFARRRSKFPLCNEILNLRCHRVHNKGLNIGKKSEKKYI